VHLAEAVDSGGGFFGDAVDFFQKFGVFFVHEGGEVATVVEEEVWSPRSVR